MPRTTPTYNLDILGGYDVNPIRDNPEYLASKAYEKWFMKPPCIDTAGEDIESFYIDRKVEFAGAQYQRNILRKEQHLQRKIYAQRTRVIRRNHDELQTGFVTLNNFARDSEEKKKAAMRKINAEIEIHDQIRENIEHKKRITQELLFFRDELKYTTEQYKPYETVLDRAFKKSKDFESVKDMINRCDAIMLAQGDITVLSDELCMEIEQMRLRMLEIIKQAELISLGLKNELIELERCYAKAKVEVLRWEKIYAKVRHTILDNELDKSTTRDAIYGIYRMLCIRQGTIPEISRKDIELQLDFILDEVDIMRQTIKACNKGKKRANPLKVKPVC